MLDPQAKALIEQLAAQGNPPLNQQTPTEARASRAVRTALSDGPSMAVESVTDIDMAQPDGPISLRHYRPLGSSVDQMLPAIMFFHGVFVVATSTVTTQSADTWLPKRAAR